MKKQISCSECQNKIADHQNSYSLQKNQDRHFCSRFCLEQFYHEQREYFADWGRGLGFAPENLPPGTSANNTNNANKDLSGIKLDSFQFPNSWNLPLGCFLYQNEKNFIIRIYLLTELDYPLLLLYETQTNAGNEARYFLDELREKNENLKQEREELMISPELSFELDQMRSSLLADLIKHKSDTDIGLESCELYSGYIETTLQSPDEVYAFSYKNGKNLQIFQKSLFDQFPLNHLPCYYLVICYELTQTSRFADQKDLIDQDDPVFLPLLCFPTQDENLVSYYRRGEVLMRRSLN
ncbi:MAG: hypothetical protein QE271_12210 [Bacteriovoracaceae bacterium]|nr:hypothetical protein [Bacteriovoracaceae bacterium]